MLPKTMCLKVNKSYVSGPRRNFCYSREFSEKLYEDQHLYLYHYRSVDFSLNSVAPILQVVTNFVECHAKYINCASGLVK